MHGHKPECVCFDCENEKRRPPMPVNQNKPNKGHQYRLNELKVQAAIALAGNSVAATALSESEICAGAELLVAEMVDRGWVP